MCGAVEDAHERREKPPALQRRFGTDPPRGAFVIQRAITVGVGAVFRDPPPPRSAPAQRFRDPGSSAARVRHGRLATLRHGEAAAMRGMLEAVHPGSDDGRSAEDVRAPVGVMLNVVCVIARVVPAVAAAPTETRLWQADPGTRRCRPHRPRRSRSR
jgi:hypothetical protein